MPVINFQVKIKSGKQTKTEIKVTSFTDNDPVIYFQEGTSCRKSKLMKDVEDYIKMLVRPDDSD